MYLLKHPFPALDGWTFGIVPDTICPTNLPRAFRVYPTFYRKTSWGVLAITHRLCDGPSIGFDALTEFVDTFNSMRRQPHAHRLSHAFAFVEDDHMETGFRYLGYLYLRSTRLDTFVLDDPEQLPEQHCTFPEPLQKHWWLYPAACFYRDHVQPFLNNPVADILLPR